MTTQSQARIVGWSTGGEEVCAIPGGLEGEALAGYREYMGGLFAGYLTGVCSEGTMSCARQEKMRSLFGGELS